MGRWEILENRDAESRIYLALLGQKKNVFTVFRDFGGATNDKEIPGLYTRPYIETTIKKLARKKLLKISVGTSVNGKRPVLCYESDPSVYSEFLLKSMGMSKDAVVATKKLAIQLSPMLNELSTLPPERIKKFDALFLITTYARCAAQTAISTEGAGIPSESVLSKMEIKSKKIIDTLNPIVIPMYKMLEKNPSLLDAAKDAMCYLNELEEAFLCSLLDLRKIPIFETEKRGGEKA